MGPAKPIHRSSTGWCLLLLTIIFVLSGFRQTYAWTIPSKEQIPPGQEVKNLVDTYLPLLSRQCSALDQTLYSSLIDYAALVLMPHWIITEDDLLSFFAKRDSFIGKLAHSEKIVEFLRQAHYDWSYEKKSEDYELYLGELGLIGICPFYAEGMIAGFTGSSVLEGVISLVASEPCRLYIQMIEAYDGSYGNEYTYMHLGPEMETISIGEQLLKDFPDSRYAELARGILAAALYPLTDYHRAICQDSAPESTDEGRFIYIVGELETRVFPWWTHISEPRRFLNLYPDSRFRDIIAKIANNPSEICPGMNVHVVVIDQFDDEKSARQAILTYLLQGLDIPHLITMDRGTYAVSYRFFSDAKKAQTALEEIKKIKPEAKIIVLTAPGGGLLITKKRS